MAKIDSASVITLHQAVAKRPLTGAERTRNYRERLKTKPVTVMSPVTPVTSQVTVSRRSPTSLLLTAAGFGLTGTGICMNAFYSGSLGSSSTSALIFLAVGIAADLIAFAMPSCAAHLWSRHGVTALAGWAIWVATFIFVTMNGVGFASVNVTDVTLARQERVTPAVTIAQAALDDAKNARDALDAAKKIVEQTGDPQTESSKRIVAWISAGWLKPTSDDFAMLRLVLLAILPQIGGILLMIGRTK